MHHRITNIVIMDACRDNPLGDKLSKALGERSNAVGTGLASVYASAGTLISYSTQPYHVALDGDGDNSIYSGSLARHISTPDIDVIDMLKRVRKDVQDATNKEQLPWDSHAMIEDFFFRTSAGKGSAAAARPRSQSARRRRRIRPRSSFRPIAMRSGPANRRCIPATSSPAARAIRNG